MSDKKNPIRDTVLYAPKNGFDTLSAKERKEMEKYNEDYKRFLSVSKTERKCVHSAIALAEKKGFKPYQRGMKLKAGDKIYVNNRDKAIMLAVIGKESLAEGVNIGAAHTDAPRLDLKPRPVFEDTELAYLKTHYYGGIRKYQWMTIPLELHGVVTLRDGSLVSVDIGDKPEDPKFIISDLLPHLAHKQNQKPLAEVFNPENLNLLIGSEPMADDEGKERVKLHALQWLYENYGIVEEDLISAEISAVPTGEACDIGFDRSMIAGYGHDDRVCAYAELAALLDCKNPARTAVCIFADKEEIGSHGVSGMRSTAFDAFMEDLCAGEGVLLRECYENSFCLSADVTAAFDPGWGELYERNNSAYLNYGIGLCKYTGGNGKSGASDASAEVVGMVRKLFNDNGVRWQMAELGKQEIGGGGTVAQFMAERNIDTLDAGVPVLSMHAPCETVAKFDCYMTYRGMKTIFEKR